jgi:hypothetical protein
MIVIPAMIVAILLTAPAIRIHKEVLAMEVAVVVVVVAAAMAAAKAATAAVAPTMPPTTAMAVEAPTMVVVAAVMEAMDITPPLIPVEA